MKLSARELMWKFPCLHKFKDHEWFSEEAVKWDCNHKELPMKITFLLIQDMLKFIEETKFTSRWEEGFSLKIRLQHARDLLSFFCDDTEEEKTIKGSNLGIAPTQP
jgi:hypothetical protein